MGKRGPKAAGDFASKGATLSARITTDTRRRLDQAAAASGRSVSQELETRLIRSFDGDEAPAIKSFGGHETYALLRLVSEMIKSVEDLTGKKWLDDRFTHDLVCEGTRRLLNAWRPTGDGSPPDSFPNFVGFEQSPSLRANFRAGAERSIRLNRDQFLLDMVHSIISTTITRVQDAPRTSDPENKIYRRIAEQIGSRLIAEQSSKSPSVKGRARK